MKTTKSIFGVLKITLGLTSRIRTSSLGPLLWLLLMLPVLGAQGAVVFTTLYSFGSVLDTNGVQLDGAFPAAALVQGNDGNFYGTTSRGSTMNYNYNYTCGTVFQISTNGVLTTLYSFTGTNDGAWPFAALVQGSDGSFYGTTYVGGTNDRGTVFQISNKGALTTLYSFGSVLDTNGVPLDGAFTAAALVQGSDGYFYGTTSGGGTNGAGTVFKISTKGALTTLYSFTGGNDGGNPPAGLAQGSDGYFYGTTANVGTNGFGTVFKIGTNGTLTSLYSFGSVLDTNGVPLDGGNPLAALVQGSDGNFYGTTEFGGTVFKISTNGVLTTLHSFTGGNDGGPPHAALVQGSDGYFYGTTSGGGTNGAGTVFKISTRGALTTLYSFTGGNDGGNPPAGLAQGSDGNFYGTTSGGGTNNAGTVFRLTIVPQPQLTIIPSEPYVILTWPTNYAGYTLQSATNLGSSAVWTTNSSPPVVIGGENVVINTMSGRQQFYRLIQ
jgi:uncharacterized repeat protein (TIGR03803 family)